MYSAFQLKKSFICIVIAISFFSCDTLEESKEQSNSEGTANIDSTIIHSLEAFDIVKSGSETSVSFNLEPRLLVKIYSFENGYTSYRKAEIYDAEGEKLQQIDSIPGGMGEVFLQDAATLTPRAVYIYDVNDDGFADLTFVDECAILDNCNSIVYLYNNIAKTFQSDRELNDLSYNADKEEYYSFLKDQDGIGYTYSIYKKIMKKVQQVYVERRELIDYNQEHPDKSTVRITIDIADSKGKLVLYKEWDGILEEEGLSDPIIGERRF